MWDCCAEMQWWGTLLTGSGKQWLWHGHQRAGRACWGASRKLTTICFLLFSGRFHFLVVCSFPIFPSFALISEPQPKVPAHESQDGIILALLFSTPNISCDFLDQPLQVIPVGSPLSEKSLIVQPSAHRVQTPLRAALVFVKESQAVRDTAHLIFSGYIQASFMLRRC